MAMTMAMMMTFGLFQCGRDDGCVWYCTLLCTVPAGRKRTADGLLCSRRDCTYKLVESSYTIIYNYQQQERHDTMSQGGCFCLHLLRGGFFHRPHLIYRRTAPHRAAPRHATPVENKPRPHHRSPLFMLDPSLLLMAFIN